MLMIPLFGVVGNLEMRHRVFAHGGYIGDAQKNSSGACVGEAEQRTYGTALVAGATRSTTENDSDARPFRG